jgi:hypothetical protein
MKYFIASLVAIATLIYAASAGDSFFSADGKTVTFIPLTQAGILWRMDVASGKLKELPLPPVLKESQVTGLARGADGEALFLANNAVWVMTTKGATIEGAVKKVCETGSVKEASDLFVAVKRGTPISDWMFIKGSSKDGGMLFARKPKQMEFGEVFCRRVRDVSSGCFSDDGRFFFTDNLDVWEGGFVAEDDPNMRMATLVGARTAPIALQNTDIANAGSLGVSHVSAAGQWIYAGLSGRHMGAIMRVPISKKPLYSDGSGELPKPKAHLDAMHAALQKTEVLVSYTDRITAFCACEAAGNANVFYRGERGELSLWTDTGETKQLGKEPLE